MPSAPDLDMGFDSYDTREALTAALGQRAVSLIATAIAERGRAVIAVSGGSTPKPLYEFLSRQSLDWSKVTVVLVDERWVEPGQSGSNESFVLGSLLQGEASQAHFVGLKTEGATPLEGLDDARLRLDAVKLPFDLVLLGLGPDGHTASWFPRAHGLADALTRGTDRVAAVKAHETEVTGKLVQRITLTRSALDGAGAVWIMIAGESKREAWHRVMEPGPVEDLPARALLKDPELPLEVHWAA